MSPKRLVFGVSDSNDDQDQSPPGTVLITLQAATFVQVQGVDDMTASITLTGRCLCGSVKVIGTANELKVAACHCEMCRRWSSGPFFEVSCENVTFDGEDHIRKIRSSDWAERGFCKKCGSNLFYHIIDSNEFQIAAGLFDDQSDLRLSLQVFTDRKPPFYTFADKTETMTAAEVYAAYAPPSD